MRYSSRTFISLLVIAGLLSGVVLVAPPAAAVSTTTWTSTADFDLGDGETVDDATPGSWSDPVAYPQKVGDIGGASYGGYAWGIGGYQNASTDAKAYNLRYNPTTNSWSIKAAMPVAKWGVATTVWADRIYAFAGNSGTQDQATAYYYNVTGDIWTGIKNVPAMVATTGACANTYNSQVYLLANASFQRYDPANDAGGYTALTAPTSSGTWMTCAGVGNYHYVMGGTSGGTNGC